VYDDPSAEAVQLSAITITDKLAATIGLTCNGIHLHQQIFRSCQELDHHGLKKVLSALRSSSRGLDGSYCSIAAPCKREWRPNGYAIVRTVCKSNPCQGADRGQEGSGNGKETHDE